MINMKIFTISFFTVLFIFFYNSIQAQTASVENGCAPLEVVFSPPGGLNDYFWDFKNGASSPLSNPTSTFIDPGVYEVELYEGVTGIFVGSVIITVYAKPELHITATPSSGCVPLPVNFEDSSIVDPGINVTNYQWVFGDGNLANGNPVSHVYTLPGTYTIGLAIETNFPSCNVTEVFPDFIAVGAIPVANFITDPNPASACTGPFEVSFNNLTNNPGDYTFSWDFGNGETSTIEDPPSQIYTDGSYVVTLVVTNSADCSRTITRNVNVGAPVANFEIADTICLNDTITMVNLSPPGSNVWNFGAGATPPVSTQENPDVVFTTPGFHDITLTVSVGACTHDTTITVFVDEVLATIMADPSYTCEGRLITEYSFTSPTNNVMFEWVFFDGTTSTEANPIDTIEAYDLDSFSINDQLLIPVFLNITNPSGCMETFVFLDTIHRPNAFFRTDVVDGCIPLTVEFQDSSTSNEDIVDWEWHFGDGTVQNNSTGDPFTYTYTTSGDFPSYLIVTNDAGCRDTSYLLPIEAGEFINAPFSLDQNVVCPGDTINFEGDTSDPRIDTWHFETDQGRSFHCYNASDASWSYITQTGSMDVSLTVGYNGCFSTFEVEDAVTVKGPIAQIDYLVECGNPYDFIFRDSSHDATSISWEFGDSTMSSISDIVHTYDTTGTYTVILTAENATSGCMASSDTIDIYVRDIEAIFELDSLLCFGSTQSMDASASIDVNAECWRGYTWITTFNRPITTQDSIIPLMFGEPGMHSISLITTDINGCTDTLSQDVQVYATQPVFSVDDAVICFPSEVQFTDMSTADTTIVSWDWTFGDGNTSTDQNPSNLYINNLTGLDTFSAVLMTTDIIGCQYSASQLFNVYQPTSEISAFPNNICLGEEINFSATDYTIQGSNLTFDWNFGDGQAGTGMNNAITYTQEGSFNVVLNFEEIATGCADSTSIIVNVQDYPIASFESSVAGQSIVCYPENIIFTENATSNNALTFSWDFGNGQIGQGASSATVFDKGTFDITMVASTSFGCTDTVSQTVTLVGPEGDFLSDLSLICKGDFITFNLIDTVDISSFSWDFGDGEGADDIDPVSHQFNFLPPGSQTLVKLVLRGLDDACAIAVEHPIQIINVLAEFSQNDGLDTLLCVGDVFFTNESVNADTYIWDFGDGSTSSEFSPGHLYDTAGTFEVNLIVESEILGCTDTVD
ncbi:MAG: PKD repeat protein, partial [Saprospiraceae bacterium]